MKTHTANHGPGNGEEHSSNGVNINSMVQHADVGSLATNLNLAEPGNQESGKVAESAVGADQKTTEAEDHNEHVKQLKQFINMMAAELLDAVARRVAVIRAELFHFLLQQPLVFFVVAYAQSKLGYARKKGSQANVEAVASHLRTVARICLGFCKLPLDQLDHVAIHKMVGELENAIKPGTDSLYKNGAVNAYKSVLGCLLKFLADPPFLLIPKEKLPPMLKLLELGDPSDIEECPLPTPEEERALTEYIQRRCGRGAALKSLLAFHLYVFYGVRRGMVEKIDRSDVNLEQSRITLTFNKKRNGKCVRMSVVMPPVLKAAFEAFMAAFPDVPGQPFLQIVSIECLLNSAARACGMGHLTPRTFRKRFITRALEAGVEPATIALIVGHASTKSIEHYQQFLTNHIDASLNKVNGIHLDLADPAWAAAQRAEADKFIAAILQGPKRIAAAVIQFIGRLSEKARVQDVDGVLAMVKLPDSALPALLSEAVPSLPRAKPLTTGLLAAANLRSLFWRNGEGYNEVCEELDIPRSAIYPILRGERQTDDTVKKLAGYFGVTPKYLEDPDSPRYSVELVVRNVKWLAARDGIRALPGAAKMAQVVNNADLPTGKHLRSLAEHVGVELKVFLSEELSLRADLQKDPLSVALEDRPDAKQNLAGNLEIQLLLKGLNRTQAAWRMPMRANQFDNYVSGRSFPPPEKLEMMAVFFGMTSLELLAVPPAINVAEVSRNITAAFNTKAVAVWVAAQRIGIAPGKLARILSGEELPSGPQLHAIALYLGVTPGFLLGLERPSVKIEMELPEAA